MTENIPAGPIKLTGAPDASKSHNETSATGIAGTQLNIAGPKAGFSTLLWPVILLAPLMFSLCFLIVATHGFTFRESCTAANESRSAFVPQARSSKLKVSRFEKSKK